MDSSCASLGPAAPDWSASYSRTVEVSGGAVGGQAVNLGRVLPGLTCVKGGKAGLLMAWATPAACKPAKFRFLNPVPLEFAPHMLLAAGEGRDGNGKESVDWMGEAMPKTLPKA